MIEANIGKESKRGFEDAPITLKQDESTPLGLSNKRIWISSMMSSKFSMWDFPNNDEMLSTNVSQWANSGRQCKYCYIEPLEAIKEHQWTQKYQQQMKYPQLWKQQYVKEHCMEPDHTLRMCQH